MNILTVLTVDKIKISDFPSNNQNLQTLAKYQFIGIYPNF
jgi:hypothetical protein